MAQQAVGGRGQRGQATPLQGRDSISGGDSCFKCRKRKEGGGGWRVGWGVRLPSLILDLYSRTPHPRPTSGDLFFCQTRVMNPTLLGPPSAL